ncbi:hypothetical protein CR513_54290, partial [Mucuna pruriens]
MEFTSWGCSLSPMANHTFYWSWTTCLDGLKQWPPRPMIPRFSMLKALISDQGSHFRWCTGLPQHTTPKQMAKSKYSTGKSRRFYKSGKDSSRHLEDAL